MEFQSIAAAATVLAACFTLLVALFFFFLGAQNALTVLLAGRGGPRAAAARPGEVLASRKLEVRERAARESLLATFFRISDGLLALAYLLGGAVLTSTFAQQALVANYVGWVGLIVLLATVLRQWMRPDVAWRVAGAKAAYLRRALRAVEDLEATGGEEPRRLLGVLSDALYKADQDDGWGSATPGKGEGKGAPAPSADQGAGPGPG